MQFLYPSFLWALILLAIPIVIHLFYFKRFKKVYFTNVRFLKEVKEETSSRKKLRNLLVLLMRLVAITFLVMAFAQPYIPVSDNDTQARNAVSVFIDNSFSMNALSEDVPLFDRAKDKAREIIQAFSQEDLFQVINHDLEMRHQRLVGQEDALSFIEEMEISPSVTGLSKIHQFQLNSLNDPAFSRHLYYISDFQKNITDIELSQDSSFLYNFIVLQSVQEQNVSIDSVWFVAPVPMINQANPMIIQMSNYSNSESENIQMNLSYENQIRPLGIVNIRPNSTVTDTFNLPVRRTGWHEAEINIQDYPVQFDDHYKFSFRVKEEIDVLSINQDRGNRYLTAAFGGLTYFTLENKAVSQLSYGDFSSFDIIILNDLDQISSGLSAALVQYVENGGNILVFPSNDILESSYNNFLTLLGTNIIEGKRQEPAEIGTINTEEFIFNDVFEANDQNIRLPKVQMSYTKSEFRDKAEDVLMTFRDGTSFLSKYLKGDGQAYVCMAPLSGEYSDLARNAEVFIPMLYKMAISTARKQKIAYIIGQDQVISVENMRSSNETIYKIVGPDEFIPAQISVGPKILLDIKDQVKQEGIYDLILDDQLQSKLSFNYNRMESDLSCYSVNDLKDRYGDRIKLINERNAPNLASFITQQNTGIRLWRWCIILVLIFLTLESLILRFWKT